jgi:hypothetical protein
MHPPRVALRLAHDPRTHLQPGEVPLFKTGDFAVAKGIYAEERTFYLRITLDEDCTTERGEGTSGATVSAHLEAADVRAFEESGGRVPRKTAGAFFRKRAAD